MYSKKFWHDKNFKIVKYTKAHQTALKKFCDQAVLELDKPASRNMEYNSISYLLNNDGRFENGEFILFYFEDDIVAVGGYHRSDSDMSSYHCGVRTYTLRNFEYKGIHSHFMLPYQIKECVALGANKILLSFNTYNNKIFESMKKLNRIMHYSLKIKMVIRPVADLILYKGVFQKFIILDITDQIEVNSSTQFNKCNESEKL
jgi:hypothetical protein